MIWTRHEINTILSQNHSHRWKSTLFRFVIVNFNALRHAYQLGEAKQTRSPEHFIINLVHLSDQGVDLVLTVTDY